MITIDKNTVSTLTDLIRRTECFFWDLYNPYSKIILRNEQIRRDRENNIASFHTYFVVDFSSTDLKYNYEKLLKIQVYLKEGYVLFRERDKILCDCINMGYQWDFKNQRVIPAEDYSFIHGDLNVQSKAEWFFEWLKKQDFEKDRIAIQAELKRREENPDWERPTVMYGIRKQGHKCIRKKEIAVIIDSMPWLHRARMAETHWYHILYKRPATNKEWATNKINNSVRRYTVWQYFIENSWSIDKIISCIIEQAVRLGQVDEYVTNDILSAFQKYYNREIKICKVEKPVQLAFSFDTL